MSIGPVMADVRGLELQADERELLQHPAVGGVILFSRNYESPQQLHQLASEIHSLRQPPLLLAVDQEGGRVQRFRDGFFRLPPVGQLGSIYAKDSNKALLLCQEAGWLMASEVLSVGVDLSFAPVLDLESVTGHSIANRRRLLNWRWPTSVVCTKPVWQRWANISRDMVALLQTRITRYPKTNVRWLICSYRI